MTEPIYIPPDIQEDVKIGKIISLKSAGITGITLILTLGYSLIFIRGNILSSILTVLIPTVITAIITIFDIPAWVMRIKRYNKLKRKIKNLEQVNHIQSYGSIHELKDKKDCVFLEVKADPWEICPQNIKRQRLQDYVESIFMMVEDGCRVNINCLCTEDKIDHLDRRYKNLSKYSEGLREIENERIDHHYKLAKDARCITYTVRIDRNKNKDESIGSVISVIAIDGEFLGGDITSNIINQHLTPDAPLEREWEE